MFLALTKKPSIDRRFANNRATHDSGTHSETFSQASPAPLIRVKPLCPCGGGCPRCNGVIQAKIEIGQPNDIYEQEADRIADQVMRMPERTVQAKPT